jgi:hypothetical protein
MFKDDRLRGRKSKQRRSVSLMNRKNAKGGSLRQGIAALGIGALSCAAVYASGTTNVASDLSPMLSKSVVTSHTDINKLINVGNPLLINPSTLTN